MLQYGVTSYIRTRTPGYYEPLFVSHCSDSDGIYDLKRRYHILYNFFVITSGTRPLYTCFCWQYIRTGIPDSQITIFILIIRPVKSLVNINTAHLGNISHWRIYFDNPMNYIVYYSAYTDTLV